MKFLTVWCLLFFFALIDVVGQGQNSNSSQLETVVSTENNFARTAAEKGTKAAFLQFAAQNAIMFDPAPVNARQMWQKRAESTALLAWKPTFAGISATGDLGFTTGPWEFSPTGKTGAATAFGEFATIWKKQSDNSWKFVLDFGIDHAKPETPEQMNPALSTLVSSKNKNQKKTTANEWRAIETNFASTLEKKGTINTYEDLLADQFRVLRQNYFPFVGKKEILEFLKVENAQMKTKVLSGGTSADLAYAYGEYEMIPSGESSEKGHFMRVWKRNGNDWRIVLDLARPLPVRQK